MSLWLYISHIAVSTAVDMCVQIRKWSWPMGNSVFVRSLSWVDESNRISQFNFVNYWQQIAHCSRDNVNLRIKSKLVVTKCDTVITCNLLELDWISLLRSRVSCRVSSLLYCWRWTHVSQSTDGVIITSLWRQNDVMTSFWCNNNVIVTSCVRWGRYPSRTRYGLSIWSILEDIEFHITTPHCTQAH